MPISTIILMNIGAALILVAILAAAMLSPTRLRRPFADGEAKGRRSAQKTQHAEPAGRHAAPRATQRGLRPIPD